MAKLVSRFYYIGHCSINGWGFGLTSRRQPESREDMKNCVHSSPLDRNLYVVKTLINPKAEKPYLISINNVPWTVTNNERSPLYLVKRHAKRIVSNWYKKYPEYDFEFNDELRGIGWPEIRGDAMRARANAHKVTEGIEHFLD